MNIYKFYKIFLVISLCSIAWTYHEVPAYENGGIYITSPRPDETIKGNFAIAGSVDVNGFSHFELAFAYENSDLTSWFPIAASETRVRNGILAYWTTNLITDGVYKLRLRVFLEDGTFQDYLITPVIIQNDYASATTTTVELEKKIYTTNTEVASITAAPTATELSENPAILSNKEIKISIVYGVLGVLVIVLSAMLYSRFRK